MILYEFKYNDYHNKITVTSVEVQETAKSYKPVGSNGLAIYKEKLSKRDVEKLICAISTVCYYSFENDMQAFVAKLNEKYGREIENLTAAIQKTQAQKDKIKSAEVIQQEATE